MTADDISAQIAPSRARFGDAALLWLIPAGIYYAFLLTAGSSGLFAPVNHGLTFNSMLLHLLQGQVDVDPATIGDEGYRHGDAVIAYFGVFPALVRAPFLWMPKFAATDLTRIACLAAVLTVAGAKLMSVRLVWRQAGAQAPSLLLAAMTAAILLSGPQIQFLRPSIFQEVELWAGAQSAVFVYLVLRGLCSEEGFSPRLLGGMAAVAGLCLLTRVSNALGLYAAFGLIWLCAAWRVRRSAEELKWLAAPAAIAAGFIAWATLINLARWGNPLVFADFANALINDQYPDRLARLQHFGQFRLARLPYALGYYFAPVWVLRDAAGNFLWPGFEDGFSACCAELPPDSFFISDPLLIGLCAFGLVHALRKGGAQRRLAIAAGLGLLVPILLMLTAFGMSFRYRMEFYPFFELFALLGFARLASRPTGRAPAIVAAGAVAGIITAHASWVLYMLSPFGPAGTVLGGLSAGEFYRSLFR
jgi:hypothetical protein